MRRAINPRQFGPDECDPEDEKCRQGSNRRLYGGYMIGYGYRPPQIPEDPEHPDDPFPPAPEDVPLNATEFNGTANLGDGGDGGGGGAAV